MERPTTTSRSSKKGVRDAQYSWVILFAVTAGLTTSVVLAHGASKGLHLHLSPDPAARGDELTVEVSAEDEIAHVRLAFAGFEPLEHAVDPPAQQLELKIEVPRDVRTSVVNCHAEVRTGKGKTLRASAVLQIRDPLPLRE